MDDLANVWPWGGVFAFSGVDGPTCHAEPFVATGTSEGIGWQFGLEPPKTVYAGVGQTPLAPRRLPTDFCLADCWHCTAQADGHEGHVEGVFVDRHSMTLVIAFPALSQGIAPDLIMSEDWIATGPVSTFDGGNWHLAIYREPPGPRRRFGLAISYKSGEEARARAQVACAADLDVMLGKRMEFLRSASVPESLTGNNRRAFYKAVSIGKAHVESPQGDIPCRWTTRDHAAGQPLGLWDTAFHALGLQHLSVELAHETMRALFSKQLPDGLVPSSAGSEPLGALGRPDPPLLAWSICRQSERLMDVDFLTEIYPKLFEYLGWYEKTCTRDNGLFGWELVRDNTAPLTAAALSSYMASEYCSLEKIARCLEKGADVKRLRERRTEVAARINEHLWDDEGRFYYDLDEYGEFVAVKTPAGFMPLLGQVPDGDQAEALRMHLMNPKEFWTPFPVPAVSQDEPSFSKDSASARVDLATNTLLYYGLMAYGFFQEARQLARTSVQEAARCYLGHGCLYEFYDAQIGDQPASTPGKGAHGAVADFPATAACFLNFANEIG